MLSNVLAFGVGLVELLSQIPLFGGTFWHAHSNKGVITPQLSTFIEHTLALEHITGLSVAVVPKQGEPEFHTWGHRSEDGDEVTPETRFHMASVSKAFCATALGLLIDDFEHGRNVTALPTGVTELTWHTRLRDVLPGPGGEGWALMDTWASERANFKDILGHVSGVPRHDAAYGPSDKPLDMIGRLRYLRPAFELREQWSYNNIMYMVAAHVIETYAGQSYTSFVQERIFVPLGMTSTTFSPAEAEASGQMTHGWTSEGRRVPECFNEETAFAMAGPGGIISNAIDMAKWISTWINEGVYDNQTVIPDYVYKNVSYSYSVSIDHPTDPEHSIVGYGMGWFRTSYRGHNVVWHSGAVPGLSTLVSFLPSDEIGVTLFANGEDKAEPLQLVFECILDSALVMQGWHVSPSRSATQTEPDAQNATLALSLDAFAGTYSNPGYGAFTLCSPSSPSTYCTRVQSDFSIVDNAQGTGASVSNSEDLLAAWSRVWSSHIRMRHQHDLVFDVYLTSLYPNGYGKDTTPFATKEGGVWTANGVAEFVVEEGRVVGFGLAGLVGHVTERARTYEGVRDRAEVWFDRV
ncbi:beta-lactamase/transpeptidase-like protein [Boletus edulis BED1]|uniref:Beta-lactamase/transpeptidase-like protein n=1 Tax=Boletus edulis BED1 TaxID=1328754 RepID=A0AAD4GC12_BOLED|nr:beta-lactamase/transpeptidase-like protein [Boletus edulis BED1]